MLYTSLLRERWVGEGRGRERREMGKEKEGDKGRGGRAGRD